MATNKATIAANHIKYVSEKKHFPVKILNYLQNNGDSNYDYDSVVKKIQELIVNGVTDQSYKIINPVNEVSPLMMKLRFVRRFQTVTILIANHPNLIHSTSQLQ